MTQEGPDNTVRLAAAPIGAWMFGALLVSTLMTSGIFLMRSADASTTALIGGAANLPGLLVGLLLYATLRPLKPVDAAFRVLAFTTVRLGVSLGVALLIHYAASPEALPFWLGFLAPALIVLGVETGKTRLMIASSLGTDAKVSSVDDSDQTTRPFRAEVGHA